MTEHGQSYIIRGPTVSALDKVAKNLFLDDVLCIRLSDQRLMSLTLPLSRFRLD